MRKLKLEFADIVVALISKGKKNNFVFKNPYLKFTSNKKPHLSFFVYKEKLPHIKSAKCIFDPGVNWEMFCRNGEYIIKANGRTMIVTKDLKGGHIYIDPDIFPKGPPINYPLDEILMIKLLAKKEGVIVHACGIDYKGKGIIFVGSSGKGKSTIANLWKKNKNVTMLSDDRIIIRKIKNRFWIYGTPWHGNAKLASPKKVPLNRIFFLKHASKNSAKRLIPIDAASRLMVCSFPTFWDKKGMNATLNLFSELAEKFPFSELKFVPNESVLKFIKDQYDKI